MPAVSRSFVRAHLVELSQAYLDLFPSFRGDGLGDGRGLCIDRDVIKSGMSGRRRRHA